MGCLVGCLDCGFRQQLKSLNALGVHLLAYTLHEKRLLEACSLNIPGPGDSWFFVSHSWSKLMMGLAVWLFDSDVLQAFN